MVFCNSTATDIGSFCQITVVTQSLPNLPLLHKVLDQAVSTGAKPYSYTVGTQTSQQEIHISH